MPVKRHTEEQIIRVLKEVESGMKVADICRKHGISDGTYYAWKSKYGGLQVNELKRLRALEDENRKLKQIIGEQTLDIQALKAINSKNW